MRTAIYARKSTESDDRQVQSLEDQIRALTSLAGREGLRVSEVFQESRSAKLPGSRPEFARLAAEIEAGRIDAVLTWSIDRLSRNPVDGGLVAYLLQTGRLSMIRTAERAYRSEDNALLLSIETGMATAYIQELRRNVMRGMRGKAERGWHACKAPIGYLNDPITREIVPDPERFPIVRLAWEAMMDGSHTVAEAHRDAVARGLAVARRKGAPRPVSLARFHSMFREPFYAGRVEFGGRTYPGRHEAMVSEAEFAAVQGVLDDRHRGKKPRRKGLPFAGCMRCARCGGAIVGEARSKRYAQSGRVARYVYYHCVGKGGCPKTSIREEDLFAAVEARLSRFRLSKGTADWLKDALCEAIERDAVETALDVATLERERARQQGRLRKLTALRLDDELTAQEHASMRSDVLQGIDDIEASIRRSRDSADRVVRTIRQRLDAAVRAGELTGEGRDPLAMAEVLRTLGTCVLNLSPFDFRFDPLIEKIAGIEPLVDGSERPKRGDLLPSDSVWWTLVDDLRTLAADQVCCADERERARMRRYGRYSWRPGDPD